MTVRGLVKTAPGAGNLVLQEFTLAQPADGEVIVEVNQEPVTTPADVTKKIDALKSEGRKSALLLVANPQGEVTCSLDASETSPEGTFRVFGTATGFFTPAS